MNFKLEEEFSKVGLLQGVGAAKRQIDDLRPIPADIEGRIMQKLRLDWNYHSNAIEGNRLSYGETVAFLMEGITAKGKPLKDHLDIRGHNEAINFLLSIVKDTRSISEADIRALHTMILVEPYDVKAQTADGLPTTKRITLGEYKTLPNHVKTATGETHYYATPEETPIKMRELMEWYGEISKAAGIHPVVIAALFHHKFVSIHPFDDGNGRLSRILMNLILMQKGYPPVIIKMDDRQNYYSLLSRADKGDNWPFIEYIGEQLLNSLRLFITGATGGDIDEDEDIDKEIALFKMELQETTNVKERRSIVLVATILGSQIKSLVDKLDDKAKKFQDLFFGYTRSVRFDVGGFADYSFNVIDDFIDNDTDFKGNVLANLKVFSLAFDFVKYKNSKNDFNISTRISIWFEEYYYNFSTTDGKIFLSKLYHEKLTTDDELLIKKILVREIKESMSTEIAKNISRY